MRRKPLYRRFTRPGPSLPINDVRAGLLPFADEVPNELRRVLQISVDYDHGVSERLVQTRRHCDFLAEVAAEVDESGVRILFYQALEQGQSGITAAVVHVNHLPRVGKRVHHLGEAAVELKEHFLLVVSGNDDREMALARALAFAEPAITLHR